MHKYTICLKNLFIHFYSHNQQRMARNIYRSALENIISSTLFNPNKLSALLYGTKANTTDPNQIQHKAASDQGLHFLLRERSFKS